MPKDTTSDKPKRKAPADKPKKEKKEAGPKRALSAYMFFVKDWRERIKEENPDAAFGEIGKLMGAKWKEMSDEDKQPYVEQAEEDKVRAEKDRADAGIAKKKPAAKAKKAKAKSASPAEEDEVDDD
ncbi:hypothetical protein AURDEDRAFT_114700 [Auricularia subglabra TFB-10046 SS5]|nr:hypothetical protein AURDEDRAFT_114700 [Auricularia subglabra TFB-10046 SS5]